MRGGPVPVMPKPEPHPHLDPQARWALAAVAIGAFCVQLDSFALNLALPVVRGALHGSVTATPWVVSGYLLAAGSLMPLAGRLGDLWGRRRMLTAGLVLFGVSAVLCALAPSLPLLVAARVVQGAGGALIMPVGLALLTHSCPPGRGRRVMGRALGLAGLATVCGPFIGGVLARSVSWRAVFWLTVPLALAAALAARRAAESRDPDAGPCLDAVGAIAATGVPACLARWLEHVAAWGWAVGGVLLGALFVRAERRSPAPLVDLALFRNRPYVGLTLAGAVANSATVALWYVVPWTLQQAAGWSVGEAGVALVVPAGALAVGGPLAGRVRTAAAVPVMALCLATAGGALLATTRDTGTPALLVASTAAAAALGVAAWAGPHRHAGGGAPRAGGRGVRGDQGRDDGYGGGGARPHGCGGGQRRGRGGGWRRSGWRRDGWWPRGWWRRVRPVPVGSRRCLPGHCWGARAGACTPARGRYLGGFPCPYAYGHACSCPYAVGWRAPGGLTTDGRRRVRPQTGRRE